MLRVPTSRGEVIGFLASGLILFGLAVGTSQPPTSWDYDVYPGKVVLPDGSVIPTGTTEALAVAAEMTDPAGGDVIRWNGYIDKIGLAWGDPNHRWIAQRPEPFDFTVVAGKDAVIGALWFGDKQGGVDSFAMEGGTIDARGGQVGVMVGANTHGGMLKFGKVLWQTNAKTKWGARIHGSWGPIIFEDCDWPHGGQEHAVYVDNAQGLEIADCRIRGWGRTGIQSVLRWWSGSQPHGRPTNGDCIIEGNRIVDCGWEAGGSAWSITIAGWINGTAFVRNNYIESGWGTGGVIGYLDRKQHELEYNGKNAPVVGPGWVNPNGFAIDRLVWKDNTVIMPGSEPNAAYFRDMNAFGSIEHLEVIVGNKSMALQAGIKPAFQVKHKELNGQIYYVSRNSPNQWNVQAPEHTRADKEVLDPDLFWVTERP